MEVSYTAAAYTGLLILVTLVSANVIYNSAFHPLNKVPGPVLWAATRLPWCWYQYQGRLNHKLLELHIKYGHAVRVAPNEISFTTFSAWKSIYGHRPTEMGKDPVFSLLTPTGAQNILTADRETHVRQRRLLSHAFSEKALREQEPILQYYADKFLHHVSLRCATEPLDLTAWFHFVTYDMIGDLSFGEQFGCLDRGAYDSFVGSIPVITKELVFTQMLKYFKLLTLRQWFLPKAVAGARLRNVERVMKTVDRRIHKDTDRKDFLHYILAANDERGMSRPEINVNAFSLTIAGSESTATLLTGAMFYILTHKAVYKQLTSEIRKEFNSENEITLSRINGIEFLDAVIAETLRIYPPVAVTLPRVVPGLKGDGEMIDGVFVPAGTTVGVNHFACSRHPDNFSDPENFAPERWLEGSRDMGPFDRDDRNCSQPFSYGPRNCLGKNLARAELRLIMAKILWRYDLELQPPQQSRNWQAAQKIYGFWVKGPLMCRLTPVKHD